MSKTSIDFKSGLTVSTETLNLESVALALCSLSCVARRLKWTSIVHASVNKLINESVSQSVSQSTNQSVNNLNIRLFIYSMESLDRNCHKRK